MSSQLAIAAAASVLAMAALALHAPAVDAQWDGSEAGSPATAGLELPSLPSLLPR